MKFGGVQDPGSIDFSLPDDHPGTSNVLSKKGGDSDPEIFVGCAKWNRKDLKNFYPKGTSDELEYYGSQFNSVEMNATFYRNFPEDQVREWYNKVPDHFRFFPKINQRVSHFKWLNGVEEARDDFIDSVVHFEEKLGTVFLQLRGKFRPKFFDRVVTFIEGWPDGIPLAAEFRHTDWFNDPDVAGDLYQLLEENNVANVIVDTAGRRDLLHMRLTNNETFVRYVGANHPTDFTRLDEWVQRLKSWTDQGLEHIHFFVHQNDERRSPELAAHFIKNLNEKLGSDLKVPNWLDGGQQGLF
ncbi:DUF72 domain-containing protein [Aliifodinibius sp. S!AR15-10]|uniref:DUF72 domain-containing protein n=1 Tax=Aliifodinibius sp. S!AR15-10 TaxID=2950437 RepID=UPI002861EAB3|nr:DUF72 domain-containing protein [Aliifodinibius sp. S!AR15-10]MDR8389654.1 DUF72 domain-containing protein [Aliifodinibius sp. S!AR15-10]